MADRWPTRVTRSARFRWGRARRAAVARTFAGTGGGTGVGRVLVDVAMPIEGVAGGMLFRLGTDPYDERVTCLADLGEERALPPAGFTTIALSRPLRGSTTECRNVARALQPGGRVIAVIDRHARRQLRSSDPSVVVCHVSPRSILAAWGVHS